MEKNASYMGRLAGLKRIKSASEHAAQVSQKMGTAIYQQNQAAASANADGDAGDEGTQAPQDDEVVDAEIVDDASEGGAA